MKTGIQKFTVLAFIFALTQAGLFSQELSRGGNRITAVSVTGLKRTKPYVIEKPLQKFVGMDAESIDINDVFAVVQSSGVLEAQSVQILDNQTGSGKTLAVNVKEKWAILPVPIFSFGSGGWTAGGAVIDTNAFGIKDNMVVMGGYGTGGGMATVMYIHSPNVAGDFGWNLMGMVFFQDNEDMDQKDNQTLRRYKSINVNPSIGISYKLTDLITPSFSLSYRGVLLRAAKNPINAPQHDMHGISFSPSISARHNTWDGVFLNETSASVKYNYTLVIGADDVHTVLLNAVLQRSIIAGLRYIIKTGGVYSTASASPFFESSPGNVGIHILSQKYSALTFAGGSLGMEKSLFKFAVGTVSILAAYEAVYSDGEFLHHQVDHGPALMLQLYFSKIAFPGMGLGAAYNVDKNKWQYAFSVGASF